MIVRGRRQYLLPLQLACDLIRAFPCETQGEDFPDNLGCGLIDQPLFLILRVTDIAEGDIEIGTEPVGRFHRPHGPHLLAGLRCIPFIENVVEGHHLRAGPGQRVHVFLDGDELYAQRGIDHLKIIADLQIVSSKSGEVFHDDRRDLSCLNQFLHLLEAGALKGRPTYAVIIKELRMQIAVSTSIVIKDHALILDGVRFFVAAYAFLFIFGIVVTEACVQCRDFFFLPLILLCCCHKYKVSFPDNRASQRLLPLYDAR